MIKVTLDTNILVSGLLWTGDSHRILKLADKNEIQIILSRFILEEVQDTLNSEEILEKIKNKNLIISNTTLTIIENSLFVEPTIKLDVIKDDPDDNIILECAKEGKVDYIITKDNHLLKLEEFEGIKIVNPDEFLRILKE